MRANCRRRFLDDVPACTFRPDGHKTGPPACVVITRQHLVSDLVPRCLVGPLWAPEARILNAGT